ncbi:MAG: D-Ala-D-Ala carboxypeptidase family metallohydrolase [Aeromonadaceae bacterium]
MDWADYPSFTKAEFDCKHTGKNEMTPEFMKLIQSLRTMYGKPLTVTSGYRHPTHPVEARKGHSNGEHTRGACCDLACTSGTDRYNIIRLALSLGFTRIGIAKTFIHLGIGGPGLVSPTIWDYS